MGRRIGVCSMLVLLCLVLSAPGSWAQWVRNGVPVCSADYYQWGAEIVTDGANGAMIVWTDNRWSSENDIYGNRIDANGIVLGGSEGVAGCIASGNQYLNGVVFDGAGGVIVVWLDERSGNAAAYAQRIDTTGNVLWAPDGINVCPPAVYPGNIRITADGAGGAIISWSDYRSGSGYDIYAQRVDGDGNLLWGDTCAAVCTYAGEQYEPEIMADGYGGAIIAWIDYRGDGDIYVQRIDAAGNILWNPDGVPVCVASANQYGPRLAPSSGGGAYVSWSDYRDGYEDIYVQRIDEYGSPVWPTTDGMAVTDYLGWVNKSGHHVVEDGAGGVIVAWFDDRSGQNYDMYGQHLDSDGTRAWGAIGRLVLPCYSTESDMGMVPDGAGGAIMVVDIYQDEESYTTDIYAQRVDRDGNALWGPKGAVVCSALDHQLSPALIADGFGGAIIVWEDQRALETGGASDIYCQRVGASGLWGDPEPEILSCADVPGDQGGWVRITTKASSLDAAVEYGNPIAGYNVWRMMASGGGGPEAAAARVPAADRSKVLALLGDPATAKGVRVSGSDAIALGLPDGDWESVGFWFATRDSVYYTAVPTRNDSTEAGTPLETFIVTAHMVTPGIFVTSEPAEGYSVDNLAPGITEGLAGEQSLSPAGLRLTWDGNAASDLWKYNVHRGDDALFVPGESNLIGTATDLTLLDPSWASFYNYFYKLIAVDRHGNKGAEALLRPEDVKVGTMLQGFAASLKGGAVEIVWTLAEVGANASFRVLRTCGEVDFAELSSALVERDGLSFTCVDGSCEPGTTYRYRVDVVEESGARALFETGSISTPAMPLTLDQNHPNPFNPATMISFYLPEAGQVTLDIYDSAGSLVTRLLDRAEKARGTHRIEWGGMDREGRSVSSGVYFYRLRVGRETISKKMVLVR